MDEELIFNDPWPSALGYRGLSDVIHDLEMALAACRDLAATDDFLAGWAKNTADAIKSQLDKVQA